MKIKQICLAAALTIVSAASAYAQDIHFSQFYMSPSLLNPAMVGVMNCNGRFIVNYRNQWASALKSKAFNTYSATYDMALPVGRSDFFGGGITLWGDQAGTLDFATTQAKVSASYSKRMGGYRKTSHYLVVGAEGGLAQRSINLLNARYPVQNSNGTFDANLPSYEGFPNTSFLFGDVGAGLLWYSTFSPTSNFHLGVAAAHLNRANQSFTKEVFQGLYTKFTIHGGGEFMFNKKIGMVPNIAFFAQGPSFEFDPGTAIKFNLSKNRHDYQAFQVGLWTRLANHYKETFTTDAVILTTRFDYNEIGLGFSYDANISEFNAATGGNGGFEFNLQYKICKGFNRPQVCPNF